MSPRPSRDPARLDGVDRLVVAGVIVAIVLAMIAIALVLGVS